MPTVTGPIVLANPSSNIATHYAENCRGGIHQVANAAARLAIPANRLRQGMLVREDDTGAYYELSADLATWTRVYVPAGQPVPTYATVAALRATPQAVLATHSLIELAGYYAAGDGGGGLLRVDASDTTTADDGGSCFVVGTLRIKGVFNEHMPSIKRWGAQSGSGLAEPATGCAAKIQAAITWAYGVKGATLFVPDGDFWLEDTIHMRCRVSLQGTGTNFVDGVPDKLSSETKYRASGNSVLLMMAGKNKPMLDFDGTGAPIAHSSKPQMACHIQGLAFHGNWENQGRYDCHGILADSVWGVVIRNNTFMRIKGYVAFVHDCNTVHFFENASIGQMTTGKSIVFYSCGDCRVFNNEFGGGTGPILWITGGTGGTGSWVSNYHENFLYNAQNQRFVGTALSANTITLGSFTTSVGDVISNHTYETGMPVEVIAGAGGTIPTGTVASTCYFAVKIGTTQIKLASTYANALAGTTLPISGGAGTWYVFHGKASGIYASNETNGLVFSGNRTEQHAESGITLAKTLNCVVSNNISVQNGQTNNYPSGYVGVIPAASGETAAGVAVLDGAIGTVIQGNVFASYVGASFMDYGVWLQSTADTTYVGTNTYGGGINVANIQNDAAAAKLVTTVVQTGFQTVLGDYNAASIVPLKLIGGISGGWLQEWDRTAGVTSKFGVRLNTGLLMFGDRTNLVDAGGFATIDGVLGANGVRRLWLGSDLAQAAPKPGRITAEAATGTDISGAEVRVETGLGTGAGAVSAFYVDTPVLGSTGIAAQTRATRMRIGESGVGINRSTANASAAALQIDSTTGGVLFPRMTTTQRDALTTPTDGTVIYNTTLTKLQVRAGAAWVDLH